MPVAVPAPGPGFTWRDRTDAILTVCEVCLPERSARWLRDLRASVFRVLRTEAITIALAGCTRLCPGQGRLTLILSLPDGRTLSTAVMPTDAVADRLVGELGLLLGERAWRGRRVLVDPNPGDGGSAPRRARPSVRR